MNDVVVIGAGFVGSFVALNLAKQGVDSVILEEHGSVGYPQHCTGLVSREGLARLGLLDLVRKAGLIQNRFRCFFIRFGDKGKTVCFRRNILYVLDRPALDILVNRKAIDLGAKIKLNAKVKSIDPKGVIILRGMSRYEAKIIVDAEGATRTLIRRLGVNLKSLPAIQMDIRVRDPPENIEIYPIIPDFILWVVPISQSVVRVGLASKCLAKINFLETFARKRFRKISIIKKFGGLVHIDGPSKRFVFGRIAGVGDAVGQTKPTTGGGVVLGGLSAILLSKVIGEVLRGKARLSLYEHLWWKIFGADIRFMLGIRKILFKLDARIIAKVLSGFVPSKIHLDYDYDLPWFSRLKKKS